MLNCVNGVFPEVFQGWGGRRGVMYRHMGLRPAEKGHTRVLCLLRKGILPSRQVKKEVLIGAVSFFTSIWLVLPSTPNYALPRTHDMATSVVICSPAGFFPFLLCRFTASSRTTIVQKTVPKTCRTTRKLWAMPLVYPVLLSYLLL